MIWLRSDMKKLFPQDTAFDRILGLRGKIFRELANRRTLRFEAEGCGYFAKLHFGVGWREIFKNLLSLHRPVLSAKNEVRAIRRFEELGIETMTLAGYGIRGWNPARRESFLITDELSNTLSLEDLCKNWPKQPPPPAFKRALIRQVAQIARTLHENGVNHRDFYLCHFLIGLSELESAVKGSAPVLHVIDLHRVQLRRQTPERWIVKDLAALFFSSIDIGLTRRDVYRFLRVYRPGPLRERLFEEKAFWSQVVLRTTRFYERDFERSPRLPKGFGGPD